MTHARLGARYDAADHAFRAGSRPSRARLDRQPGFNVPASMLGVPAVSLPLLSINRLPLGLQIAGFAGEDARLFAVAAGIRDLLASVR